MARKRKDVLEELQKEAEARLAQSPDQRKDSYDRDGEADIQRLLYELRTHQVELQIQNAELQDAYNRLEAARDNYYHLYNFAPVSYLTILKDTSGRHFLLTSTKTTWLSFTANLAKSSCSFRKNPSRYA